MTIQPLNQRDDRWAKEKLGTSINSIGNYGCLLVCCTMIAKYYGHEVDPIILNSLFVKNGSYQNGNLYRWYEGLPKVFNDIKCTKLVNTPANLTKAQFDEIDNELSAGRPVIFQVDFNPQDAPVQTHFVLCVAKENDNYIVNDPWYGDRANITRYGVPKITIQQYAFHSGEKVVEETDLANKDITWDDFEGNRHIVKWYVDEWEVEKKEKEKLASDIASLTKRNEDLQKDGSSLRQDLLSKDKTIVTITNEKNALKNQLAYAGEELDKMRVQNIQQTQKIEELQVSIDKLGAKLGLLEKNALSTSTIPQLLSEIAKRFKLKG